VWVSALGAQHAALRLQAFVEQLFGLGVLALQCVIRRQISCGPKGVSMGRTQYAALDLKSLAVSSPSASLYFP